MKQSQLAKFRKAGLDTLQLSLESMDEATHDSIRGSKGNYAKLMTVFRWAKELGLNICLSAVLTRNNFDEIKKIIRFGRKEGVFVLLNPVSSSGAMEGNFNESIVDKRSEYYQLLKAGNVRADTVLNFRGGSGCPAGVERLYITPYGEVMTCPHVQVSYGNVREEPLSRIYDRISHFPYLAKFEKHCRHIWNKEYIDKLMKPTFGTYELPISVFKHPIKDEPKVAAYLRRKPKRSLKTAVQ
jgi:MoaA/NifB/PqqE/SkfB family radical SAM enzyme